MESHHKAPKPTCVSCITHVSTRIAIPVDFDLWQHFQVLMRNMAHNTHINNFEKKKIVSCKGWGRGIEYKNRELPIKIAVQVCVGVCLYCCASLYAFLSCFVFVLFGFDPILIINVSCVLSRKDNPIKPRTTKWRIKRERFIFLIF